tara:strand:- start:31 stop:474 length:444 start_codon:yes stop_codon:yes gene_type:complete
MKIAVIKTANNRLWAADDISEDYLKKLSNGEEYEVEIKLKQNSKLHRKIFGFFNFCTQHYYGDMDAHKDEYQREYVRKKLTVIAGYCKAMYTRDGSTFELVPLSLSYNKMSPEERGDFYSKIIDAALKRVFDRTTDERILNQLTTWF